MKKWLFPFIVILQVLYLTGMAGAYYAIDWFGETVTLKTAPIDPRDLFYGDYVIVNYEISTISQEKWSGEEPRYKEKVYVKLKPSGRIYEAVAASHDRLELSENEVIITGRYAGKRGEDYQVDYGIERYYVEENTGKQYEMRDQDMVVDVALAPWGQKKMIDLRQE